jgi:pimeloyl-ACP methyl ester carboxylesterase
MTFADVNGAKLWYEVTGEGEPVIHIHGAGFGHFNFATATPIESKYFQCIDFDQRGYGQSDKPIQHYDMEVWADDVAGLMDHLGLETAHVHGTSMGGMVAQVFGAKYGHRTRRLIINCSAAKLDYAGRLTFKTWIDIAESMGCGSRALAELLAVQALSHKFLDGPDGPGAVDMIQDILERSNRKEVFQRACQAMIDMDLRDWATSIAVPTLVIGGEHDSLTPPAMKRDLASRIPGARLEILPGCGHMANMERPEAFNAVMLDFLGSHRDRARPSITVSSRT